jgi:hypothetical protein
MHAAERRILNSCPSFETRVTNFVGSDIVSEVQWMEEELCECCDGDVVNGRCWWTRVGEDVECGDGASRCHVFSRAIMMTKPTSSSSFTTPREYKHQPDLRSKVFQHQAKVL